MEACVKNVYMAWQVTYHFDVMIYMIINTLRPRQNGRHFAIDIFKCIFSNENVWIPIKISLKLVTQGPINNISTLVRIMAWRQPGDKPLSEPMMIRLLTHICVTRPQWIKVSQNLDSKREQIYANGNNALCKINIWLWMVCMNHHSDNYVNYDVSASISGKTQLVWFRV